MSSPFHVDGEFSPYRALFVAALLAVAPGRAHDALESSPVQPNYDT